MRMKFSVHIGIFGPQDELGTLNFLTEERILEAKQCIAPGGPRLGVNRVADHGIAGRGVLIDIEGFLSARGKCLDYATGQPISVVLIDEVAAHQGIEFCSGDILLLRTGWLKYYFDMSLEERTAFPNQMCSPGLQQSYDTLEWIWDHQFSVCA